MATDATGTPTPKGIPKYDPANDAPSGLGFNAAMDAIDAILDDYIGSIGGIATGEVPVWNGTAWVRSSVTNIGPSSLGSGTPDSSTFLRGDGTWTAAGSATYGTSLPGSPVDGQEHIYVDSTSAPTYWWRFRYNAGSASTHKWEFVGGSAKVVRIDTSETTNNDNYIDIATVGPDFTLPLAGDWDITIGANAATVAGTIGDSRSGVSYAVGGTAAADSWGALVGRTGGAVSRSFRHLNVSASTLIRAKYKKYVGSTSQAYSFRELRVQPSRVS